MIVMIVLLYGVLVALDLPELKKRRAGRYVYGAFMVVSLTVSLLIAANIVTASPTMWIMQLFSNLPFFSLQ